MWVNRSQEVLTVEEGCGGGGDMLYKQNEPTLELQNQHLSAMLPVFIEVQRSVKLLNVEVSELLNNLGRLEGGEGRLENVESTSRFVGPQSGDGIGRLGCNVAVGIAEQRTCVHISLTFDV